MKNYETIDPTLWMLITTKDFDSLTESEKLFVLTYIDKETYYQWRKTTHAMDEIFHNKLKKHPFPKKAIKQRIDEKINKKRQASKVTQIVNFQVPLWQMAASWTVLIICFSWYFQNPKISTVQPLQTKTQTDTVYIQSAMKLVRDTLFIKPKFTLRNTKQTPLMDSVLKVAPWTRKNEKETPTNTGGLQISGFEDTQPKGQSLKEDTVSEKFMVGVM